MQIEQVLERHQFNTEILKEEIIQELWSGYGKLLRVRTASEDLIIKLISSPNEINHPKGFASSFAHDRKMKSYQVEMNFYSRYHAHLAFAHTPKYLAHYQGEEYQYIILSDLKKIGFKVKEILSPIEVQHCIEWLANFHYTYLNHTPHGLWDIGSYWHLDTRPDEYQKMPNGPLKEYAKLVDIKLNQCEHQTIVHGDAKLANFLFKTSEVSALDFQYTGGGVGVKDLAYFLSSIYNEDELQRNEKKCLEIYFSKLKDLGASTELIQAWQELYPYAWFDFYRFLAGWSPGHYKINAYIKLQMQKVLDAIK